MSKLGVLDVAGTKYTLKLGETYMIGVKSIDYTHDIEIDDSSVDIKHCLLDFTERPPKLFDLRSKCGTFVDGLRVATCQMVPLVKSTTIQFGNVEAPLQLTNESDSGYLEGRTTPSAKDDSEIICNSPENAVASSRLKLTLKSSLTSTPNATATTNKNIEQQVQPVPEFLAPTGIPRRSVNSNTSARSIDSFCIPETQCPVENNNKINSSINISFDSVKSKERSLNIDADDDDFFIPETQEVMAPSNGISAFPRVAFGLENINETIVDGDKIPSSQFRICTQDFNGFEDDDGLSNHSDDILANIPCSLVIPAIHHSPVRLHDNLIENNNDDEEDIEPEMSALQWSARTGENTNGSVTPDDIAPVDGQVTPDVIEGVEECLKEPPQQPVPYEPLDNPSRTDDDLQPTQVFVKPSNLNKSAGQPLQLPCDKENQGPQHDECLFLPPTQVFLAPSKTKLASPRNPTLPVISKQAPVAIEDDDDLPPTQVFYPKPNPASIGSIAQESSKPIETCVQMSQNSCFKAKCNKLLDSDDDEMDEVVVPELMKQMRESLSKNEELLALFEPPPAQIAKTASDLENSEKENESTTPKEPAYVTPQKEFALPTKIVKKAPTRQTAVDLDTFLFTPDILGKNLEFSNSELKISNNYSYTKNLLDVVADDASLADVISGYNFEGDRSPECLKRLLPPKRTAASTSTLNLDRPVEKEVKTLKEPAVEEENSGRITRRRKSTATIEFKEKKIPRKNASKSQEEPKKEGNTKNDFSSSTKESRTKVSIEKTLKDTESSTKERDKSPTHRKASKNERKIDVKPNEVAAKKEGSSRKEEKKRDSVAQEKEREVESSKELKDSPGADVKKHKSKPKTENKAEKSSHSRASSSRSSSELEASKPKHNNDSKDLSNSNIVDGRSRLRNKESEQPGRKRRHPSKDSSKSSKSSIKEEKLSESKDAKKKKETKSTKEESKKSTKDVTNVVPEEKLRVRLPRLRSGLDLAANDIEAKKANVPVEKNNIPVEKARTRKDKKDLAKEKNTSKPDRSVPEIVHNIIEIDSDEDEVPRKVYPSRRKTITEDTKKTLKRTESEVIKAKRPQSTIPRTSSLNTTELLKRNPSRIDLTPKLKITTTMCDYQLQKELEQKSGRTWFVYTTDPKDCDVLVVHKSNRTLKLIIAIARGIPIVKSDWLVEVLKAKTTKVSFDNYLYDDEEFQKRLNFDMNHSLRVAKSTSLFDGMSFMTTPNIRPVPNEMKDIITCAGGAVLEKIPAQTPNQRIYLISDLKDIGLWHRYRRSNENIKIVSSDGVMSAVMQQSEKPLLESISVMKRLKINTDS